ncbi:MAG: VWA domain-containing protein [Alphaproteobacteria bacterium]
MYKKLRNSLLSAAAVLAVAAGLPNNAKADLFQVGFLLDSSGSITSGGWSTIVNGLAGAIPQFLTSSDTYELSVVSFSGTGQTQTIVNKQVISLANIATLQAAITGASFLNGNTNYADGFNAITTVMDPAHSSAAASYLNFATDGQPNQPGSDPAAAGVTARNAAIAAGIDNISIEGIGGSVSVGYLTGSICFPLACTTSPTFDFPAHGFYIPVASTADYAAAVEEKIRVITGVPEPASLAVLGTALLGFGVIRRRQRHNAA